jgi:hypothetical protein
MLSGCANLSAVREFTATSVQLTGYQDVTQRYVTSATRVKTEIPEDPLFDRDRAAVRKAEAEMTAQKESLLKLHNAVTGYMAALAKLAGDDAYDISPQIDKVTGAIVAAPSLGLNAQHVQAFGGIAAKVSSWLLAAKQAKGVKSLVVEHGDSMDVLLDAMATVTTAMRVELDNERGRLKSYHDAHLSTYLVPVGLERPLVGNVADPAQYERDRRTMLRRNQAVVAWANRGYEPLLAEQDRAIRAAKSAIDGIQIVRNGHDDMRKNVDHLTKDDVTKLLKKASAELRVVRAELAQI